MVLHCFDVLLELRHAFFAGGEFVLMVVVLVLQTLLQVGDDGVFGVDFLSQVVEQGLEVVVELVVGVGLGLDPFDFFAVLFCLGKGFFGPVSCGRTTKRDECEGGGLAVSGPVAQTLR